MIKTANTYRTAATENGSHLGLLLATYDVLAEDIRLAGKAAEAGDIEDRCRLSGHAALLLGHLESWAPLLEDTLLETSLIRFYAFVRSELMRLQSDATSGAFEQLALQVGETRAAWQQKGEEVLLVQARIAHVPEVLPPGPAEPAALRFSCSA